MPSWSEPMECAQEGCPNTHPDRSGWDAIKAHNKGWFEEKGGLKWCPEHIPEWVAEWRSKRADLDGR